MQCLPGNSQVYMAALIGDRVTWGKFPIVCGETAMPCASIWTTHLHPIPSSSRLIIMGSVVSSICFSTGLNDRQTSRGRPAISQRTTPLDWPSCFIWDAGSGGHLGSHRVEGQQINPDGVLFLHQVLCRWRGVSVTAAQILGLGFLVASVTASLDIDTQTN